MSMIRHPFLVCLEGQTQDERQLYLVLDYIAGGELFNQLRSKTKLESDHARNQAAHLVLIFEQLHDLNIIQRDLKPENILINTDGYLKLTDFGFAKKIEGRTQTLCGTPEYLAPEILLNKGHGKTVDWWCLGILVQEMLAGIDPFSDEDPMVIYQKILKGKLKFPKNFDKNAKSLVKHFLVADLTKRQGNLKGGVADIKGHRWFKGFDFNKLINKELEPFQCPSVKNVSDTSNFCTQPDSDVLSPALRPGDDPFVDW